MTTGKLDHFLRLRGISGIVLCGVMLAAGGFTLTALVEIFNIKRLHSIVRPTILTAFLGYLWSARR